MVLQKLINIEITDKTQYSIKYIEYSKNVHLQTSSSVTSFYLQILGFSL